MAPSGAMRQPSMKAPPPSARPVVPVEVTSHLPDAQSIYLISESNPFPLVARLDFPEGTVPYVATRIKVAQSCNIYAVVRTGNQLVWTSKATQVTIGGCGG